MAHLERVVTTKTDGLSLILGTHAEKGKNSVLKAVICDLCPATCPELSIKAPQNTVGI